MPGPFILLVALCLTGFLLPADAAEDAAVSRGSPPTHAYSFRNPYYSVTSWKLWFEDGTPVDGITLRRRSAAARRTLR